MTDVSNASRTMLFNIHTLAWDDELLRMLDMPASLLPEVRASSEVYGRVAAGLGLDGVPIAGMAGDQQAALFGQMCVAPGMAKNTYGTGCFLLQNTGDRPCCSDNRLISTVAWKVGGRTEYALEGSVFIGGAVVQWLRDGLGLIRQSGDVERLAASVPDNGGVYLVPAFAGLGAPHWDPYARGTIVGITRGTTAGHIARAAVESIAYQVADLLDAVHRDSGIALGELRVDGGAARNDALMQFQADLLRRAGGAARGHGDHRARRGVPGRARGGLLGLGGGDRPAVAGRTALRAVDAGARTRTGCAAAGTRRWGDRRAGSSAGAQRMNRAEMLSRAPQRAGALGHRRSSAAAPRAWASPWTRRRAATTCCCSSSTTSARARRAAARSWSTAASGTSSRATSRSSWRR